VYVKATHYLVLKSPLTALAGWILGQVHLRTH
jgi:hypothetical protein